MVSFFMLNTNNNNGRGIPGFRFFKIYIIYKDSLKIV